MTQPFTSTRMNTSTVILMRYFAVDSGRKASGFWKNVQVRWLFVHWRIQKWGGKWQRDVHSARWLIL